MNDCYLEAFPKSDIEALAMLYVRSQDLTGKTPEELLAMYDDAVASMRAAREEQCAAKETYF